jgi:hypothetical protein
MTYRATLKGDKRSDAQSQSDAVAQKATNLSGLGPHNGPK